MPPVLALAAVLLALARRWRCRSGPLWAPEALVVVAALGLGALGLLAALLAAAGVFSGPSLELTAFALAVLIWPWGQRPPELAARPSWKRALGLLLLLGLAAGLRWPPIPADLGGRDQGTYVLRARHTLRTGRTDHIDPVLARAGAEADRRPGPGDILGLYPIDKSPERAGRYEGAYRPGFYLARRDTGAVVPQFLHLQPALMAVFGLAFGPWAIALVAPLAGLLTVLALWALAERLWPRSPWPWLAAGLFALSPIAVWTARTPLSESLTGLFVLAAAVAVARPPDPDLPPGERDDPELLAALLLGLAGFVRGNLWLSAPALLAVLWLRPGPVPGRMLAPTVLVGLLLASLALHLATAYPYLHDEFRRQLGALATFTPTAAALAGLAALAAYLGLDLALARFRGRIRLVPPALAALAALAVLAYLVLRAPGPPWSRLDPALPLLGAPLLLAAGAGLLVFARLRPSASSGPGDRSSADPRDFAPPRPTASNGPSDSSSASPRDFAHSRSTAHATDPADPSPADPRVFAHPTRGTPTDPFTPSTPANHLPPGPPRVWLLALATLPVTALALYAQRNLPQVGLYYYGRYLVPELLPAACLLAALFLAHVHTFLSHRTRLRRHARWVTLALGLGLLGAQALPYLRAPVTRLQEFAGAERLIDDLAAAIPEHAVVLAGGEGWHHVHVYSQLGGALAFGHGRAVLPYRSREAAYATLHELLVARPAATGEDPPPVFLLLGEATHPVRPKGAPAPLVIVDDHLPPPFVARRVAFAELYLDRLTPVDDRIPDRVARNALRVALLEVRVDPARRAEVRTFRIADGRAHGPAPLNLSSYTLRDGQVCLAPDIPLVLDLPPGDGPGSLVLVAHPGADVPAFRLALDGVTVPLDEDGPRRARDTLGPVPFATPPRRVELWGSPEPRLDLPCPHGALAEVRLLGPDRGPDGDPAPDWTRTYSPPRDLGHPVTPFRFTTGRALSRMRPGIDPGHERAGPALVVRPGAPLIFPIEHVPNYQSIDLAVSLRDLRIDPGARLVIWDGATRLAEIDPPDHHDGAWQSTPVRIALSGPAPRLRATLESDDPDAHLGLRDLVLFNPPRD